MKIFSLLIYSLSLLIFSHLGVVYINFLPIYPKEKVKELTVEQLLAETQKAFDEGLEKIPKDLAYTHNEHSYFWFIVLLIWALFWIYKIARLFI